ncbi:putative diguanylate cyclase YdaM [Planctomycetes bacterium CA13]|uniref:diguanylate cyclase n=1 Tax=Novipirellula herctigrandis TaxID=2527986 RepID=A0A5C5Z819_9BACT|nr:putative diguanylate cyclase YdaM [Planctomycetes bacterium CA13]
MTDSIATSAFTNPVAAPFLSALDAESATSVLPEKRNQLEMLLAGLQDAAPAAEENPAVNKVDLKFENRLAMVRLGIATSLFYSLRAKHVATAAHSLRVALSCSTWAHRLGLEDAQRDRIEVAALLHDLGKIGIPDRILRKPGKLTVEEQLTMDCCSRLGCEILHGCTDDSELLDTVLHANTWFESRRCEDGPQGDALPLGSRMLSIADAFDAMTTDHVYRNAMSRERAIQELSKGSGTQFDPELVIDFSRMVEDRPEVLQGIVADRWLKNLQGNSGASLWASTSNDFSEAISPSLRSEAFFLNQLVGKLKDGIAFTDNEGTITRWNDAMQRITSISADAIGGKVWSDETIRLRERDASRHENACVVSECLLNGTCISRPMLLERPGQRPIPVHVQVSPVTGDARTSFGVVVVIRDLSDQASLEEKVETLHEQTTRDSLTGIFNRAYFDSRLTAAAEKTSSGGATFSLIICDIDHFKRVNDVHGHPAGDQALIQFASTLENHSRDGDVVARYGGEEFLLICKDCDNATATKRAEVIRGALERTPLSSLGGAAVTASFGVTEYQAGDSAETILARADRALLKAKDNGRNRVIQLGAGNCPVQHSEPRKRSWFGLFESGDARQISEFDILTPVPVDLAIEKLRGFIADHDAKVIRVNENQVSLKVNAVCTTGGRRRIDHHITLDAQLTLSEQKKFDQAGTPNRKWQGTKVHAVVRPIRNRDRRSRALNPCITQLIASLKSYIMGEIIEDSI